MRTRYHHLKYQGTVLVLLWLFIVRLQFNASAEANQTIASTVAVIDFQMTGETQTPDNWAVGLADLVALELQQQDIPIFERRSIRLVLAERQLVKMGVTEWQQLALQKLPQIQYFVSGAIRRASDQNYQLSLSLTDVRSGHEAASFAQEGRYPNGLFPGVKQLAQQVAEHLRKGLPRGPVAKRVPPGFTRKPEVAWLFYKGLEHCLAGQPEWGALYFIDAQNADPGFLAPKVWKLRAFQMMRIPDYIQACREELLGSPQGAAALTNLDKAGFLKKDRLNLALVAAVNPNQDLALFTTFKNELRQQPALSIFDPHQIDSLTTELDLQLSEVSGDPLDLATMAWTAVDVVLRFRIAEKAQGPARIVIIEGRDALSAALLFEAQTEVNADLSLLSQNVAEKLNRHQQTSIAVNPTPNPDLSPAGAPFDPMKLPPNYWTNRAHIVNLLKYTQQYPNDRRVLLRLQGYFRERQGYLSQATWNRYIATLDPKDPFTPTRISVILWMQRGFYPPKRAADDFALLLRNYPDSLETQNVRSVQALEAFNAKNYELAVQTWTNLLERLPRQAPAGLIQPDYWAFVYFFTAAALTELNRPAEADPFLRRVETLLKIHPEVVAGSTGMSGLSMENQIQPRWVNHFLPEHPYFGVEKTLADAVTALRQRLNNPSTPSGLTATPAERLEQLLKETFESDGAKAAEKDLAFIREVIRHKNQNPKEYDGSAGAAGMVFPMREINLGYSGFGGNYPLSTKLLMTALGKINQLIRLAPNSAERQQLEQLATELAQGLSRIQATQCYLASGQYEHALALVEEQLQHQPTSEGIRLKSALLRAAKGPAASAEYLLAQSLNNFQVKRVANPFQLGHQAANDFRTAGLYGRASQVYAQLINAQPPMEHIKLSFKFYQAECELRAGNAFQATELLREIIKAAEGKHWFLFEHTRFGNEPGDLFSIAADTLQRIRFLNQVQFHSFDWEPKPSFNLFAIIPAPESLSDAESDLYQLLLAANLRRTTGSYSHKLPTEDFTKKFGRTAVPALLKTLTRISPYPNEISVIASLLQRVATAEDASPILEAFRHFPELAGVALQVDPQNARTIIAERFPIYYRSYFMPYPFNFLIPQYKLRETYRVLIANLADNAMFSIMDAQFLDRILTQDPVPETIDEFRQALTQRVEKQLAAQQTHQLGALALIAIPYGVPEGIEAWFRCKDVPKEKFLATLRPLLDLPADDTAALLWLESHRGQWIWNAPRKKYALASPNALNPGL